MGHVVAIVRLKLRLMLRQGRGAMQTVSIVLLLLCFVLPVAVGKHFYDS